MAETIRLVPLFVEPIISSSKRAYYGDFANNAVNISLCTEIVVKDEPNGYGTDYPIIEFKGCNVKWYFGERGKALRDKQYKILKQNFFLNEKA